MEIPWHTSQMCKRVSAYTDMNDTYWFSKPEDLSMSGRTSGNMSYEEQSLT